MASLKNQIRDLFQCFIVSEAVLFWGGYRKTDWPNTWQEWTLLLFTSIVIVYLIDWLSQPETNE